MIKDPERNSSKENYIDFLENMDSSMPYSSMSIIDPNDNHLVDTDNSPVSDAEISDVNKVLYACDNIPKNFAKSNVTVSSKKDIFGVNTLDEDVRFSKSIDRFDRIILNKTYKSLEDYRSLLNNFNRRAKNSSKLIIMSSEKNPYIRKIAQEMGLSFNDNGDHISVERDSDRFKGYNVGGSYFKCILCNSEEEKLKGLQAVDQLEEGEGMAFPYDSERMLTFSMKSVSFPIDIIFSSDGVIQDIYENIQPGDLGFFSSMADLVIELNGGTCESKNINVGDECFAVEREDREIEKVSSYDAYFLTDLVSVKDSMVKCAGKNNFVFGKDSFGERINYSPGSKSFFGKRKSYFEPIRDRFILINDSELSNENAKRMFSSAFPDYSYKILKVSSRNSEDVGNAVQSSFYCDELNLFDFSLSKQAAFPVPNSTREKAISVDREILKNIKRLKKINSDLEKNKSVYESNKDNYAAIRGSQGVYRQSMKRLVVSFKALLYSVKVIVKSLESIKDTTNVDEINGSILTTVQNLSKFFKSILEMQDKTESMEFFSLLSQRTEEFIKISEDLETVHKRARDFIWTHILGTPLLTD